MRGQRAAMNALLYVTMVITSPMTKTAVPMAVCLIPRLRGVNIHVVRSA
jgi:hypothetical protein